MRTKPPKVCAGSTSVRICGWGGWGGGVVPVYVDFQFLVLKGVLVWGSIQARLLC